MTDVKALIGLVGAAEAAQILGIKRHRYILDGDMPRQKWIPVTERLPEEGQPVLGYTWFKEIGSVRYDGEKFVWSEDGETAYVKRWADEGGEAND